MVAWRRDEIDWRPAARGIKKLMVTRRPGSATKEEEDGRLAARRMKKRRRREDESALMEHHLRMEELGEKMTSSRNCELTMMLSTSIESEQEDTEKQHDECFLGNIWLSQEQILFG